jgi:DNA-nicking Smr family endonuclease
LFRREMAGVVPLKSRPKTESRPPRKPIPDHRPFAAPLTSAAPSSAPQDDSAPGTSADGSSHRKNGIQNRTLQKLKRGRFRIEAQLDLHNMTVETARSVLLDFIATRQSESMAAVRVIHGKGLRSENGPRLKQMTRQVLRDHPLVRAYASCKPSDGGDGAVDVLLKTS